ncbi:twin-arginine translocation signal domain-containing protein [Candidatus Poribacteria bacterium]
MSEEKAISQEELEEVTEEMDESDRRAFLKRAAQAAGAMAVFSVVGALIDDGAYSPRSCSRHSSKVCPGSCQKYEDGRSHQE